MTLEPVFHQDQKLDYWLHEIERVRFTYEFLDPKLRNWFERDTLVLRAHFSTRIEGNVLREEEVDELVEPPEKPKATNDEREVINYIKALRWIDDFSKDRTHPIDERVIRNLHKLILGGIDPSLTPGEYRTGQNYVRDPATRKRIFMPPDQGDVPDLMRDLSLWLRESLHGGVQPVLVAGVAHLQFVAIHPFWDGNGRVARALSTLIIQRLKYGFDNLIVLDRYFGWNLENYFARIAQAVGDQYEGGRDMTEWLQYFAKGVSQEAHYVHDRTVDASMVRQDLQESFKAGGLKSRQADGVMYCVIRGRIRPKDYQRINEVSPFVTSKDLGELADREILLGQGQTRNRVYILHPNLEHQLEEQKEQRAQQEPVQLELL